MALFWVVIGICYLCNICHCGRFYDAWPFDPNNPDKIYGSKTVRQGWTPNWNKQYTSLYEWINQPPSVTLRGRPLQSRGDLIKVEMKWDVNTGEPAKNYEHEQSKDGAPVPPYGCIKIIWYKDDDDYTLNCMGGDFISYVFVYFYILYICLYILKLNKMLYCSERIEFTWSYTIFKTKEC